MYQELQLVRGVTSMQRHTRRAFARLWHKALHCSAMALKHSIEPSYASVEGHIRRTAGFEVREVRD
jgi:hypothetical protein